MTTKQKKINNNNKSVFRVHSGTWNSIRSHTHANTQEEDRESHRFQTKWINEWTRWFWIESERVLPKKKWSVRKTSHTHKIKEKAKKERKKELCGLNIVYSGACCFSILCMCCSVDICRYECLCTSTFVRQFQLYAIRMNEQTWTESSCKSINMTCWYHIITRNCIMLACLPHSVL